MYDSPKKLEAALNDPESPLGGLVESVIVFKPGQQVTPEMITGELGVSVEQASSGTWRDDVEPSE